MEPQKAQILDSLARAVIDLDVDGARAAANSALACRMDPYEAIMKGLTRGMEKVNELYEAEEYFVPELLISADAMYAGIEVLRPHMPKDAEKIRKKAVIGVVKGDTHDIGKNLVRILLDNAGFEMHDLGRDVPYSKFIDTAGEIGADLVCLSTLMTTTMDGMGVVVDGIKKAGIRSKVLIGGGPIPPGFAKNIGADGYAKNAAEAVRVARTVLQGIPFSSLIFKDSREFVGVERTSGGVK